MSSCFEQRQSGIDFVVLSAVSTLNTEYFRILPKINFYIGEAVFCPKFLPANRD